MGPRRQERTSPSQRCRGRSRPGFRPHGHIRRTCPAEGPRMARCASRTDRRPLRGPRACGASSNRPGKPAAPGRRDPTASSCGPRRPCSVRSPRRRGLRRGTGRTRCTDPRRRGCCASTHRTPPVQAQACSTRFRRRSRHRHNAATPRAAHPRLPCRSTGNTCATSSRP